jgi:phosphoribosylformylglycinamidine synthase
MAFGNGIGASIKTDIDLHQERFLSFLIESKEEIAGGIVIGRTQIEPTYPSRLREPLKLGELYDAWTSPLAEIYPETEDPSTSEADTFTSTFESKRSTTKTKNPKVIIPAFPGTNSEYDSAKAFREAGCPSRNSSLSQPHPASG